MSLENPNHQIRPALPNDAFQLAALAKIGIPGYPFESVYNPESVADAILNGEIRLVVDSRDLGILATAVLGYSEEPMSEIKRVLVNPCARKNGFAKHLSAELFQIASDRQRIPWADVRGDQIGMQRAALYAGLIPISLETGKHVVYNHIYGNDDLGPGRETMVHMTSLNLTQNDLYSALTQWPKETVRTLAKNLAESLNPAPKNCDSVRAYLTSAKEVKQRIALNLELIQLKHASITEDIEQVSVENGEIIMIKPDASGFITKPNQLARISKISSEIGLQIITAYCNADDLETVSDLINSDFSPAMIRPWKNTHSSPAKWQVGFRLTFNHYDESLHHIHLDPAVSDKIRDITSHILDLC